MIKFMEDINQPKRIYILKVYLFDMAIVVPTIFILGYLFPEQDYPRMEISTDLQGFLISVFIGPVIETIIMIPIILIIQKLTNNFIYVSIISALFWGILHIYNSIPQGLAVITGFFIYTYVYLNWAKVSKKLAFLVVSLLHSLFNGVLFIYDLIKDTISDNVSF